MQALNNQVIFTAIQEKPKKATILLIDEKNLLIKAKVVSVGSKCNELKKNDIIHIPRYSDEFKVDGITYMVAKEEDICAKYIQ